MPKSNTVVVKVDKSLKQGKTIFRAAEGNWRMDINKAKNITTLVAVKKQKVVGVFDVEKFYHLMKGPNAGRVKFKLVARRLPSTWGPYTSLEPFTFPCPFIYL